MQKRLSIIFLFCLFIFPVNAQIDNTPVPILIDNVTNLTLMASLMVDAMFESGFAVADIEWSPDGEWLAIGYKENVYIYNLNRLHNNPYIFNLTFDYDFDCGHTEAYGWVRDIAFDTGASIVAITNSMQLRLYDLATGEQLTLLDDVYTSDIAFDNEGNLIVVDFDGSLKLLETQTLSMMAIDDTDGYDIVDIADNQVYTGNIHTGSVSLFELESGIPEVSFDPPECELVGGGGGCGYVPDDDAMAINGNIVAMNDTFACDVRHVNIWDVMTAEFITELTSPSEFLAISSDGMILVTDGMDDSRMVTFYNIQTGDFILTLPRTDDTYDAEFSPDGSILATISNSTGLVQLWTVPENIPLREELQSLSTVIVDAECDVAQGVSEGVTVSIGWSWYARTQEQLYDHIANALYTLTVDGIQPQRWIFLSPPEQYPPHGPDTWTIFYYMPVGTEIPGSHTIAYTLTWLDTITDGFSTFGNAGESEMLSGSCDYIVGG